MIETTVFYMWFLFAWGVVIGWFLKKAVDDIRADEQKKIARAKIEDRKALWDANIKEYADLFESGEDYVG